MSFPDIHKWNITADLSPLLGGNRNKVFRSTGLAQNVVFKSTTRSHESIAWLISVHSIARQAGFVVPILVKNRRGMLVEDGWTCETFVDGNQIGTKMIPKIKTGIARFHKASSAIEQRPGFKSSVELLHLAKGGDVNLNVMPRNLVSKCREAWNMASKRQQGIIHGDLNGTNVLKTTDGRFALVDWDECRRDLLLFDTGQIEHDDGTGQKARLAWEIACSWVAEPERARALASDL